MTTISAARRRLQEALQDPRRKQLAHVAVLDIAMTATQQLEARGIPPAAVARATEEVSALLTGEIADLPGDLPGRDLMLDVLVDALKAIAQNPAFAPIFAPSGSSPLK